MLFIYLFISGYGNDDLPWLYTQPFKLLGSANVCNVLGKWVCQTFIYDILWQNMDVII